MDDCAWSNIFGSVVSTVSLREVAGAGMLGMRLDRPLFASGRDASWDL
jgi:hypothetical protein